MTVFDITILVKNKIPEHQNTIISGLAAEIFGLVNLHSWQMKAIAATLQGKDSLIIQPTGIGKSLCFIIPSLHDGKTTIVISPTISLMTDQVNKLVKRGVSATLLGSAQKDDVTQPIQNGDYRIVYTTPESFYDKLKKQPREMFLKLSRERKLSLLAIDEAHLIFSWKNFRYISN